jgi:DNA-binding HxlR family transcriptional regulator
MMAKGSYQQFCPVAMASEILCTRWTLVLLRELIAGETRFNDLRRGLPRMSPALLSKRLKELEAAGLVSRTPVKGERGIFQYGLTKSGGGLSPLSRRSVSGVIAGLKRSLRSRTWMSIS